MNHIVIIGFMGSGKTRGGKRLAKDFNLPFVDVDRVVSKKMNLTMKEIETRYTPRISSRLIGSFDAYKFIGPDIRQQKAVEKTGK